MARPRTPKTLDFHNLQRIGYDKLIPLTGNWLTDQINTELTCFNIGWRRDEGGLDKFGHFKRIVDLLWNNPDVGGNKRFIWNPWAERILRKMCECSELGVAGSASSGKSSPAALWAVVNYIAAPTHTKVFIMSTTLDGAKQRVWKEFREYMAALPNFPGKPLWSTNRVLGMAYEGDDYSESSGIQLLAGEKSSEKTALEKLIGIKAPKTGVVDESFEALRARPEFEDVVNRFKDKEDYLRDLLPRLLNVSDTRVGKIILIIDEATGIAEGIYNAIMTNMKPGNPGHLQVIMLGNPCFHWDVHGLFCEPKIGWDAVSLADEEWETRTGGTCIRFNGEKNPRITERDERLNWMQTQRDLDELAERYGGRTSFFYHRMVLAFWCPEGAALGVYSRGDFVLALAKPGGERVVWGNERPIKISVLDPSFTSGGDKASCTYFLYGRAADGKWVLEYDENIAIKIDASRTDTEAASYQVVRNWKWENEARHVAPSCAAFDSSGAPSFADIVREEYSPEVQPINAQGKAVAKRVGSERNPDGTPVKGSERFANRATEIYYGAHPFLRSGQIRNLPVDLVKGICLRQIVKRKSGDTGRTIQIESKKDFRRREGRSPDDEDSFFLGVEHAKTRHGFHPDGKAVGPGAANAKGRSAWEKFKERARRITVKDNLLSPKDRLPGGGLPGFPH